jgi:hypothetical protein
MVWLYNLRDVTSINDANFLWNNKAPHASEQFNREIDEGLITYEFMKKSGKIQDNKLGAYISLDYLKDV